MRLSVLTVVIALTSLAGCGPAGRSADPGPVLPDIIQTAIDFHGGDLYEGSRMTMTITSLSGSFQIEATREGGAA